MSKIAVAELNNIIKKAVLNEAKINPFAPKASTTATAQQQPQVAQAGNAATAPQAGLKKTKDEGKYYPDVAYAFVKNDGPNGENICHLGINYVYDQHLPALQALHNKVNGAFAVSKKGKSGIEIEIPEDKLNLFKRYIPVIIKMLDMASQSDPKKASKYDPQALQNLENDILESFKYMPSSEELANYNASVAKNWRELVSNMNDPAVKKRMQTIGGFFPNNGFEGIDHQLTDANKAMILAQDPNATYVTQKEGWDELNREIIDPSNYIIVKVPSNHPITKDIRDTVARRLKYGSYDAFKKMKRGDVKNGIPPLPSGRVHKFEMECRAEAFRQNRGFTYPKKLYDIANTRQIPGTKNYFETEERFINNLFGIPNDIAKANKSATDAAIAKTVASMPTAPVTGWTDTMLVNALNVMIRACRNVGINFKESGNVAEDIGSAIYQYEKKRAVDEYHIPKPADQEAFANSISAAISNSLNIENAIYRTYMNGQTMTDEEAQAAMGEYASISAAISSKKGRETGDKDIPFLKMVVENLSPRCSYDEFKRFLESRGVTIVGNEENLAEDAVEEIEVNDEPTNKAINESFYSLFDKIELL